MTEANQTSALNDIEEKDHSIDTRDGAKIVVRVYQGPKSNGGPALVMLHGGGFCLGGLDNEALLCREFCKKYDGVAVNVDYRLAPEYKWPIPVHDSYDALKWVSRPCMFNEWLIAESKQTAANAETIGADLKKGFIVGGISAGGNLSAVLSHLYRDEQIQPPLTGVYLSIPSIMNEKAIPEKYKNDFTSAEENKNAPILDAAAMKVFRGITYTSSHT